VVGANQVAAGAATLPKVKVHQRVALKHLQQEVTLVLAEAVEISDSRK